MTASAPLGETYRYGNILSKSDYSSQYGYGTSLLTGGSAGPHAVVSASGHGNFTYDANGNLVGGDGRIRKTLAAGAKPAARTARSSLLRLRCCTPGTASAWARSRLRRHRWSPEDTSPSSCC